MAIIHDCDFLVNRIMHFRRFTQRLDGNVSPRWSMQHDNELMIPQCWRYTFS